MNIDEALWRLIHQINLKSEYFKNKLENINKINLIINVFLFIISISIIIYGFLIIHEANQEKTGTNNIYIYPLSGNIFNEGIQQKTEIPEYIPDFINISIDYKESGIMRMKVSMLMK